MHFLGSILLASIQSARLSRGLYLFSYIVIRWALHARFYFINRIIVANGANSRPQADFTALSFFLSLSF